MNHKNYNQGGMGMMWMMIGCMLPLLLLTVFGRNAGSLPRWVIPVAILAMFGVHFVAMRRHHGKTPDQSSKIEARGSHDHQPPNEQTPQSGV